MSDINFLRDEGIDAMISDIVDIFVNVEGVILVRLSGLTNRANKVSGKGDIPQESIHSIVERLKLSGVINYKYVIDCPHCGEKSYVIISEDDFLQKPKMCDSCNTFYTLIEGITLQKK
jgi:hypothetical protein